MSQYSAEVAKDICERVANGDTLQVIATSYDVSIGTILNWATKEENTDNYARAREAAADLFESKILSRVELITPESAAADRVAIDTLKWIAARRSPKKYGDKITQEVTGVNGDPISLLLTQVQGNSLGVSQLTADDDED
mgnify:FL=1